MIKGVCHAAIAVSNLDKSIEFYRDKLGFAVVRTFDRTDGARVVDLSMGTDQIGELQLISYPARAPDDARGSRHIGLEHIALFVDDMGATYEDLKAKGVTDYVMEPTPPRPNKPIVARTLDPDGVLLELITHVER